MEFILGTAHMRQNDSALVWRNQEVTYAQLYSKADAVKETLKAAGVGKGSVVVLQADFSTIGVAALLALLDLGAIAVPLSPTSAATSNVVIELSQAGFRCLVGSDEALTVETLLGRPTHELYRRLFDAGHPGLVLFTSGSTGVPKGVVHDVHRLLSRFAGRQQRLRTIAFLLFDHIGGLDTLFYSLVAGSCLIVTEDKSPETICAAVERYRAEVLPVSPSFLNLLLLSESHLRHDLSSLRYITYGAEIMPVPLLQRCATVFPGVKLLQRYGTSELGAFRSQSLSSNSVWLKLGGVGVQVRVVDGSLQIKSGTTMLGYLNAPAPFTEDGWLITGDLVEQDGEFIRILGRKSDLINVGGEKVFPAEVEAVIAQMPEVVEVCVTGEPNAIIGHTVSARVRLKSTEASQNFSRRLKQFCAPRLESFKVPVRVTVVDTPLHNERQKLLRQHG